MNKKVDGYIIYYYRDAETVVKTKEKAITYCKEAGTEGYSYVPFTFGGQLNTLDELYPEDDYDY